MVNERCGRLLALVGVVALAGACRAPGRQGKATEEASQSTARNTTPTASKGLSDALHPRARIETTLGGFTIELDAEKAPATVLDFVQYVQDGFYDGTIFHRVLKDSMIQGGGYDADMKEKLRGLRPEPPGAWRSTLPNKRGTIAMLRALQYGGAPAASTQFYINLVDNPRLDSPQFRGINAVFGKVVDGEETLARIRNTPVSTHPEYAAGLSAVVPVEPVVIKSIRLINGFDPLRVQAQASAGADAREARIQALVGELEKEAGGHVVTTKSGLRYIDFVTGRGLSPIVTDTIEFNYRGTLLDGSVFESTFETEPKVREVGKLIAGLQEGLMTMNEGGRRTVIVPPELGFGETGIPGRIPPDSTLVFEIELLAIR